MTTEYKDGKLYSKNGTQVNFMEYQDPDTLEVELPDTVERDEEISELFFENGYLHWFSEVRGDLRDSITPEMDFKFKGYEKQ